MSNINVSPGQLLIDHLYRGVETLGDPRPKLTYGSSEQQTKDDVPGWVVSVAVPRGRLVEEQRVTVWSETCPDLHDGQTAVFRDVLVGAVDGRVYVQAYAVKGGNDNA